MDGMQPSMGISCPPEPGRKDKAMAYQQHGQGGNLGKRRRVFTPTERQTAPSVSTTNERPLHPKQTRIAYEEDELEAGNHITSITRRYTGTPMPDGMLFREGNRQVYVHNGPPPIQRASRGRTTTEDITDVSSKRRQFHPLVVLGLATLVMVVGYVGLNAFGSWWTNHQNDATYGYPRTYQIDAVVGHGDSEEHPSHFLAINLQGHITIIEIPGGDISRTIIYGGPTLFGDGADLTPVTLSFADVNGDGKLDMLVHVSSQTIPFLNNGTKFVPPSTTVTDGESNLPIRGGGE